MFFNSTIGLSQIIYFILTLSLLFLLHLLFKIFQMELTGTIKKITDIQTFSSGFQKREVILTTDEQYPQTIAVEFVQDKTNLPDNFSTGDDVKISINIRGREWTGNDGTVKYFTSVTGWRIEKLSADSGNEPTRPSSQNNRSQQNKPSSSSKQNAFDDDDDDDLPF